MNISLTALAEIGVYLAILFLLINGLVLWYHWFSFGVSKFKSLIALIAYTAGSLALILALIITFNLI